MEISNKRCIQILKLLLKNKECMTGDNLAVAIGVSSRTIRNDMKDLNRALEDHGASVVSEIGQGYYLKIEDQEKFLAFQNEMEEQKREKDFKTRLNEITILTEILSKEVQNEKGRFRKNIADRIGISEAELQRYWDYNKFCPEIREAVEDENSTLTFSKAAELRGLSEEEQQKALEIIKQKDNISTRELRNLKKSIKEGHNVEDLNEDYSPKQEDGKKDTPKPKNDKLSKSTNQDNISNVVVKPKVDTIESNIKNDNKDIELSAIETCLSVLNTKKNELDTLLNTIKDDDKGLKMLATIDYLDKLIAKCQKDLDIKLERGNINENNREGDI